MFSCSFDPENPKNSLRTQSKNKVAESFLDTARERGFVYPALRFRLAMMRKHTPIIAIQTDFCPASSSGKSTLISSK